jgi:hypothetical protein
MAADEQPGLTRRAAIRSTAVAAGLVWTAPAMKTVGVLGVSGTPPPPSSSSSVPPTTTYTFGGDVVLPSVIGPNDPACVYNLDWHAPVNLSPFGPGNLALQICLLELDPATDRFPLVHATFDLSVSDGTVSGPSTSGIVGPPISFPPPEIFVPFHLVFEINDGTGAYSGAIGTASVDGDFNSTTGQFVGVFNGIFDVPA